MDRRSPLQLSQAPSGVKLPYPETTVIPNYSNPTGIGFTDLQLDDFSRVVPTYKIARAIEDAAQRHQGTFFFKKYEIT